MKLTLPLCHSAKHFEWLGVKTFGRVAEWQSRKRNRLLALR